VRRRSSTSGVGLARVAAESGYADQPHLNREFRALGGPTPVTFSKTAPSRRRRLALMSQTIFPVIRYRDAKAAIDFLERAFGFERAAVYEGDDGHIQHAELSLGDSGIMLGEWSEGAHPEPGAGHLYVVVTDPDAHRERAQAAGAEVSDITEQDYGSRDYSAKDLDGNHWSFGTYGGAATL